MHQGNWKCSTCGGSITELPFEPRSESGLTCRTCYGKSKDASGAQGGTAASGQPQQDGAAKAGASGNASSDRPQFTGEWKCASCGAGIGSLPFEPRSTNNLKCIDCFKNKA